MKLKIGEMDHVVENDPSSSDSSRNIIISPEETVLVDDGLLVSPVDEVVGDVINEDNVEEEEELEEDEFGNYEISALSRQLDQLQNALDVIESRNENIHKELLEILYSNREVRKTISEANQGNSSSKTEAMSSEEAKNVNTEQPEDKVEELSNDTMALMNLVKSVTEEIDKL